MRYIIVLIALLTLGVLLPSIWAQLPASVGSPIGLSNRTAALAEPAETSLVTTPSIAAFLDNNWVPPSATNASLNASFNNNTTTLDTTAAPTFTAQAANKEGVVPWTGESIFQFLEDSWTPGTTTIEVQSGFGYKKHQMN